MYIEDNVSYVGTRQVHPSKCLESNTNSIAHAMLMLMLRFARDKEVREMGIYLVGPKKC